MTKEKIDFRGSLQETIYVPRGLCDFHNLGIKLIELNSVRIRRILALFPSITADSVLATRFEFEYS